MVPGPSEFSGVPQLDEYPLPVLSWLLQLMLFEVAALLLHPSSATGTLR